MVILKYIILLLIFLNLPSFGLLYFGATTGNLLSILLSGCIILYFFFNKKRKPIFSFIILGLIYFLISGIDYSGLLNEFIKDFLRYFLLILFIMELTEKTANKELCIILLIGAISILVNATIFPDHYGRYSGFYLNPNRAGLICLLGFSFTYGLSNQKIKFIAQFLFIISGIMTLSRSFILMIILINLISIIANKRNFIGLIIGAFAILIILSTTTLQLNSERFRALQSIFTNDVDTETITKESRNETWAEYTDVILNNPILGNGYKSMQGKDTSAVGIRVGVHNTYLMTLGEAGIIPFLILVILTLTLLIKSLQHFKENPEYTYLSLIIISFLFVSHNFFDNYIVLFLSIWLYGRVTNKLNPNTLLNTL